MTHHGMIYRQIIGWQQPVTGMLQVQTAYRVCQLILHTEWTQNISQGSGMLV